MLAIEKLRTLALWLGAMAVGAGLFAGPAAKGAPPLKNEKQKLSYALGMDFGNQLRRLSVDVDPAVFSRGFADALAGKKTLMTEEEVRAAVAAMQQEMKRKLAEERRTGMDDNKKAGEAFLAENKKREGVVTLPSGLQYRIVKAGDGKKPGLDDTVVCQYRGTLIDGIEFDSSYKRRQPATFPVRGVIKGWTEALQLMPVGSKWQLFIPSNLAYGEAGSGKDIGPNATLLFEIELLSVK